MGSRNQQNRTHAQRGQSTEQAFDARREVLSTERDARVLAEEAVDVTLPWDRTPRGARHPLTQISEQIADVFTEVVLAPAFSADAVTVLTRKKNIRLLVMPVGAAPDPNEFRSISGGVLAQRRDQLDAPGDDPATWTLAAGPAVDEATLADLVFAWRACRSVKSNAILLAADGASVGIGMGQVNRVDSARLAVERAGERARGSVAASDAFFPFADGAETLMNAGVKAIVQPGGSIRDEEVIEAAKKAGVTMYLTGTRHFFH